MQTGGPANASERPPSVSVIMCTRNSERRLAACLESLLAQDTRDFELLVVDDGSTDATAEVVAGIARQAPVPVRLARQEPGGPAAGRNLGVRLARGRFVLFTDDDLTFDPAWVSAFRERLEAEPASAGAEGRTLPVQDPDALYRINLENRTGGMYATCNMAYRRDALEAVGGFDAAFRFPSREDSDLAFRILDAGGRIPFEPRAVAYHRNFKTSVWHPFKAARMMSHTFFLALKHPQRIRVRSLAYPSYFAAVALAALAVAFAAFGLPWAAAACAAGFAAVPLRQLRSEVHRPGLLRLGPAALVRTAFLMVVAYAALPFVHLGYLFRNLLLVRIGRNPITGAPLRVGSPATAPSPPARRDGEPPDAAW